MINNIRVNYAELRKLFNGIDRKEELDGEDLNNQYLIFCNHYKSVVSKFIPLREEKRRKVKIG